MQEPAQWGLGWGHGAIQRRRAEFNMKLLTVN